MTAPTPRRIRLIRADGLRGLHAALAAVCGQGGRRRARRRAVLVPTRSAAAQLRETLARGGTAVPHVLTRQEWYGALHAALPGPPPRLSPIEREVLLAASAREAAAQGAPPPFAMRAGLVAEMLAFHDTLLANLRTVDRFESLVVADLEPRVDVDRGAERLLRQTRFLAAACRGFRARVAASGALDEDGLRQALLGDGYDPPHEEVIVATADRAADPAAGLHPADLDLLARLPGLRSVTIVETRRALAAGYGERLHTAFPGLEEEDWAGPASADPCLVAPAGAEEEAWFYSHRDREEELREAAWRFDRTLADAAGPRLALVFARPLPYVYLARTIFARAGLGVRVSDALPLAAEPFAALLDQVFEAALSRFSRASLAALLRSPHLLVEQDGRAPGIAAVGRLERALLEAGYAGDARRLAALAEGWTEDLGHAARAAAAVASELAPLCSPAPASHHVAAVLAFLSAHERPVDAADPVGQRHLRARAAVLSILEALVQAARRFDDPVGDLEAVAAQVRRWMEGQTFVPAEPVESAAGVFLVDARAARFGTFDAVHLAGLVSGEWPEPAARPILYPQFLLSQLGWPSPGDYPPAARAEFEDLLRLAGRETSVSTFLLENDTIVEPSPLLDATGTLPGGSAAAAGQAEAGRGAGGTVYGLALARRARPDVAQLGGAAAEGEWARLRAGRTQASDPRYHGEAGPVPAAPLSVTGIDRYLDCPFKYFAAHVLRLKEEPEDEPALAPKARGIFVHELFRAFFAEWERRGGGAITPARLADARALFASLASEHLDRLPAGEAAAERLRLLGSAAAPGLGEIVFEAEAAHPAAVVERLLEYPFEGPFTLEAAGTARSVRLRGKVDRLDVLADGTLRVIDYKTGRAPDAGRSIQLPAYLACAAQQLSRERGRAWAAGEALYVAFGEPEPAQWVVKAGDAATVVEDAVSRLLGAVDGIEAGHFPPRPALTRLCASCGYAQVCRKDYVGVD